MSVPSVFGLPHLSEDAVAAFADGVLSAAAEARARRHCSECRECAAAVRGQREAAMMLRAAAAPCLPSGLLDRLAGLPMSAQLPPPASGLPTVLDADGVAMFVSYRPADHDQADSVASTDDANPERAQPRITGVHGFRRGVVPMGLIASAAAVVAAGTFGAQVQSLASTGQNAAISQTRIVGAVESDARKSGASASPAMATSTATSDKPAFVQHPVPATTSAVPLPNPLLLSGTSLAVVNASGPSAAAELSSSASHAPAGHRPAHAGRITPIQ
jgi:hypothetical protein